MNTIGSSHLTKYDRVKIQEMLGSKSKCIDIANELHKDSRTISKEIKLRRQLKEDGRCGFDKQVTVNCQLLNRFPFVCNGCSKRRVCRIKNKYYYNALIAQENYEIKLRDSRVGIDMTIEEKATFEAILKNGIEKGQSPYHIHKAHEEDMPCSLSTTYRHIKRGNTIILPIYLRRSVSLKPRKKYKTKNKDNLSIREGRSYKDFLKFIASKPFINIVEMDTVEGPEDGQEHKCILTLHFTLAHFMLMFILENKSKENVSNVFKYFQDTLTRDEYKRLFSVILTDIGTEFCDPLAIEIDYKTGEKLTNIFFCDSYSSYQKGTIEENHTLLRYVFPKKETFDYCNQEDMIKVASHINSYYRESIDGNPYDCMKDYIGDKIMPKLKIEAINPDLVTLKPTLLKQN